MNLNPKEPINHASELIPSAKILEDHENINTTTEVVKFQMNKLSTSIYIEY